MELNGEAWAGVAAAVVAVFSLGLNWMVVRQQMKIQGEGLRVQLEVDVLAWSQEAINVLSEGMALASGRGQIVSGDDVRRSAHDIANRLSALADRGRLFFPNEPLGDFGAANAGAYQGVRPPILDAIVFASCAVQSIDPKAETPDDDAFQILLNSRRLTVSEAQNAIDPRRRRDILNLLAEGRKDDAKPSQQVVTELHAALARRMPNAHVVKAWAESREAIRAAKGPKKSTLPKG